jgi:hypothetical protein
MSRPNQPTTLPTVETLDVSGARDDGPDPSANLRQALTTGLALAAPVLLVASNALLPDLPRDTPEMIAAFPDIADRYLTAALMYSLASLLYVPFVLALWRTGTARGAWLRFGGGAVLMVGMLSNALSLSTWGYLLWGSARTGLDPAAQERLLTLLDGSAAALPISFLAIPLAVLGMLTLAAGVLRARAVPAWAPWLWIVGTTLTAGVGAGPLALLGLVGAAGSAVCIWLLRVPRPR